MATLSWAPFAAGAAAVVGAAAGAVVAASAGAVVGAAAGAEVAGAGAGWREAPRTRASKTRTDKNLNVRMVTSPPDVKIPLMQMESSDVRASPSTVPAARRATSHLSLISHSLWSNRITADGFRASFLHCHPGGGGAACSALGWVSGAPQQCNLTYKQMHAQLYL